MTADFQGLKIGFVMCGSFCTFEKAFKQARLLKESGAEIVPVMSFNASSINSRFGRASENIERLEEICGAKVITSIEGSEPLGPKKMTDILAVVPCTGNTLAKIAYAITDTPAVMAVKSHIRNARPVVICLATNDALSGSAKNIGLVMGMRNFYFVPMRQDDCISKPTSLVADFDQLIPTISDALRGVQKRPLIVT